jgi:hypothetical protein
MSGAASLTRLYDALLELRVYVMNANITDTLEQRDTVSSFASVASFNIADVRMEQTGG